MTEPTGAVDLDAIQARISAFPTPPRPSMQHLRDIVDLLALVAAQAEQIARVRALCDEANRTAEGRAGFQPYDVRAALEGTEGDA